MEEILQDLALLDLENFDENHVSVDFICDSDADVPYSPLHTSSESEFDFCDEEPRPKKLRSLSLLSPPFSGSLSTQVNTALPGLLAIPTALSSQNQPPHSKTASTDPPAREQTQKFCISFKLVYLVRTNINGA